MNGTADGSLPETGIVGAVCSMGPSVTPPSPGNAFMKGVLVYRFSMSREGGNVSDDQGTRGQ